MFNDNTFGYSSEYSDYKGYDKTEYDIILIDGTEVLCVYPNAGVFFDMKPHKGKQKTYDESRILKIRLAHKKSFEYEYED